MSVRTLDSGCNGASLPSQLLIAKPPSVGWFPLLRWFWKSRQDAAWGTFDAVLRVYYNTVFLHPHITPRHYPYCFWFISNPCVYPWHFCFDSLIRNGVYILNIRIPIWWSDIERLNGGIPVSVSLRTGRGPGTTILIPFPWLSSL